MSPNARLLRRAITASGLSARRFARVIGKNERTVRRWLAGEPIDPTAAILLHLIAHEAVSIGYVAKLSVG